MLILGVDIGARGTVAIVDAATGELVEVHDMPALAEGPKGRTAVNPALLADLIHRADAGHAFVELVGARPGEGPVGAFAFGRCRGVVEGVLGAVGVPATHLAPAAWKRVIGIAPGKERTKDAARSEAIRRWPGKAGLFARVKDDGRAEAALIAVAGLAKFNGVGLS
jgi:crossover junction endodeoxyribonuclease RuvC